MDVARDGGRRRELPQAETDPRARTAGQRGGAEHGQATVEFAIVLPLVLLLIVGMIEFGKAFNYWLDLSHIANETARWAAVDTIPAYGTEALNTTPSVDDLRLYAVAQIGSQELRDSVAPLGVPENVTICWTPTTAPAPATPQIGDAATVVVQAPYGLPLVSSVAELASNLFGSGSSSFGDVTLTGKATVRLEQVPSGTDWGPGC
jgi:Flp pilus assembly protein TadG